MNSKLEINAKRIIQKFDSIKMKEFLYNTSRVLTTDTNEVDTSRRHPSKEKEKKPEHISLTLTSDDENKGNFKRK